MSISWDPHKAMLCVEGTRGIINRIDHDQSRSSNLTRQNGPTERVPEQLAPKPPALQRATEREASESDRWDHIGSPARDAARQPLSHNEVGGQAPEGHNDPIAGVPDKGARRTHCLCMVRMSAEPIVERRPTGIERSEIVIFA